MKKSYSKPQLKTRKIELGVFGDYGNGSSERVNPSPVDVVEDLNLHME